MNCFPARSAPHSWRQWFSLLFSLLTILLAEPLLRLIRVPEEVMGEAGVYLRIIFLGILFTFIYNFLANTLRALGTAGRRCISWPSAQC